MNKPVLEIVEFALKDGVTADAFTTEAGRTQGFVSSMDGFIRRHTARNDLGLWVDVITWRDMAAAQAAAAHFMAASDVQDFIKMIDPKTIKMTHFEVQKTM